MVTTVLDLVVLRQWCRFASGSSANGGPDFFIFYQCCCAPCCVVISRNEFCLLNMFVALKFATLHVCLVSLRLYEITMWEMLLGIEYGYRFMEYFVSWYREAIRYKSYYLFPVSCRQKPNPLKFEGDKNKALDGNDTDFLVDNYIDSLNLTEFVGSLERPPCCGTLFSWIPSATWIGKFGILMWIGFGLCSSRLFYSLFERWVGSELRTFLVCVRIVFAGAQLTSLGCIVHYP